MSFPDSISQFLNIETPNLSAPVIQHHPLPPDLGKGSFQIIRLPNNAAILFLDCCFAENFSYSIKSDDLLHIAHYSQVHDSPCCPHTGQPLNSDTFYAHIGLSGNFQTNYQKNTAVKAIHILLSPEYYDTFLSQKIPNAGKQVTGSICFMKNSDHFPELAFIFHQLYDYQGNGAAALLFYESKLNEILARMLQKSSNRLESPSRHIKQVDLEAIQMVAEYIRTHTTQNTPIPGLSRMACMSPAKLKYVFKSVFHCSVREYRLQNRVHVAKELLYHTDFSIAEIARQLGYQTSSNFSATFKKYTGFLPKAYRDFSRSNPYINFSSQ